MRLTWKLLLNELILGPPDAAQAIRIILRLLVATLLAAIIGYERETQREIRRAAHPHARGARLRRLRSGAARGRDEPADVSRVIQGVAAGIGFIGAGAILKRSNEREIQGLTTAAGIWMTAAAGMTAGLGRFGLAVMSVALRLGHPRRSWRGSNGGRDRPGGRAS